MKVLHITTNYPTPEYPIFGIFVKEQVESLKKRGVDCDVFYCDGKGRGFRQYITYVPKLFVQVLRGRYDIIHCHHALSALIFSLTGLLPFKKTVLSYQNDPDREWGGFVFRIMNIFCSRLIIKNTSSYLRFKKTVYLPNGCNEEFFRPMDKQECRDALGLDRRKIYIVYMDSNKGIREQKRKDRFDEAINILISRGYDVEPIVLRNTPREKMPFILNACDIHLLSSDFEGSPNSVKECMCCNTAVVSTDVGNVKEMIGDIPGNVIVSEFSSEALADAAEKILTGTGDFDRRTLFLAKGYGIDTVAKRLEELYSEIV